MKGMVRITLLGEANQFIIEDGIETDAGITVGESGEIERLEKELAEVEFSDFATAEQLTDATRSDQIMKKRRLEELKKKRDEPTIEWIPRDVEPSSLLLIVDPACPIDYLEDVPQWLLQKIKSNNIIVEVAKPRGAVEIYSHTQEEPVDRVPRQDTGRLQANSLVADITALLSEIDSGWDNIIDVKTEKDIIKVMPKKFLGTEWAPFNEAIKEEYGDVWVTQGKTSHWRIPKK